MWRECGSDGADDALKRLWESHGRVMGIRSGKFDDPVIARPWLDGSRRYEHCDIYIVLSCDNLGLSYIRFVSPAQVQVFTSSQ